MSALLQAQDLTKSYPGPKGMVHALAGLSLTVETGEFIAVQGPSGCGKTTLLLAAGGLLHPSGGQVQINGQDLYTLSSEQRAQFRAANIGFVFQQFHLLDDLTVAENLDIPLSYRDVRKSERQAVVADMLDRFGIVAKKDLFPSQLSGGQQQLVAVARAIIAKPMLILADEPTGNLHTDQGREIMELFKKFNQEGATIIQVTHNEAWAAYGHRIVRLRDGWLEK